MFGHPGRLSLRVATPFLLVRPRVTQERKDGVLLCLLHSSGSHKGLLLR